MNVTLDMFWTEYTDFDNKIGSFDDDGFIWKRKGISDGNSHLWHQKYSLPFTKVLDFVACIVTSKVLGIGAAERSWGDVKTIFLMPQMTVAITNVFAFPYKFISIK